MINNLKILLDINNEKKEIKVKIEMILNREVNSLKFILNSGLNISKIINEKEENIVFHEELNIDAMFIQSGKRVTLEIPKDTYLVTLEYSGKVSGWHNLIDEDYIALSLYSAWYPIFENCDVAIEKDVTIRNISDFVVVKGEKSEENWQYKCNDFDCNILAFKGWNIISNNDTSPKLNVYFKDKGIEEVKFFADSFNEIINYFTELLDVKSNIENFDIVITDADEGGYCREGLILLSDWAKEKVDIDGFLAHECGHIWSTGADASSWEDWLNETFAEILSLSFLKKKYGFEAYMDRVGFIREVAKKYPEIKTENGERPEGVHFKGTELMNRLSGKFGEDNVIEIAKLFIRLPNKTTDNLLKDVYEKIGNDVGKFIEEDLVKE